MTNKSITMIQAMNIQISYLDMKGYRKEEIFSSLKLLLETHAANIVVISNFDAYDQ